ncbi:hypothetical protein RhiirA4_478739 [Rhizophagus irregularis]|uniref:Uncharacterized protein n=1 Tax=Rhizophagus irregularis TaxID=588596 RepID=A0A2I1HFA7_9GLOM|nr:hypothetical protein RhiirA4_478739 [Rhizophagus irregularis]
MEDIPIPVLVSTPVYKKFEENNPEISLCVYEWHNQNECLEFRYVSERRGDEYKQMHKPCGYCYVVVRMDSSLNYEIISQDLYRGPDALERFVTKIEEELANIQEDLSAPAEMIMAPGDLKAYNEATECWICKGPFLKPAPEIVQKLEEAKHNLLEIKEWETCMEKEHSKKKEAQKRYREALSALNRKVKDHDHINGNASYMS